jgi:Protein of unknown function (DUF3435)
VSLRSEPTQLCRGPSNVMIEGVRSQAMGHVNGTIYERSYRNQIVDADIVSAFIGTPSDEAMMKLMGHVSLTADPVAPAGPTSAQRRQAQDDVKVAAAKELFDASTQSIRDRYGSVAAARRKAKQDTTVQIKLDSRNRLERDLRSLTQRKVNELFEFSRQRYFETLGARCLQNQHTGQEEPAGPAAPEFRFSEREGLARLLFPSSASTPASTQQRNSSSCEIIRLYASLCGRREYPRPRRQPGHAGRDQPNAVGSEGLADVRPCFLDTDPDIYPIRCPGTQCLFCLGDTSLAAEIRTKSFGGPWSLTRHVQRQHLLYLPQGEPFTCPHPSCSLDGVQLDHHDHYKNHALRVHGIVHSS